MEKICYCGSGVEQRTRNAQVRGSNPLSSSKTIILDEGLRMQYSRPFFCVDFISIGYGPGGRTFSFQVYCRVPTSFFPYGQGLSLILFWIYNRSNKVENKSVISRAQGCGRIAQHKGVIITYQIMIIEDDALIQGELSLLLRNNGYQVNLPKDLSAISSEVKKTHPHLILLDINLPVQDGFKICAEIRSFSNVPIIFVTGRNTDMDELNSIMLGGDDFITKPYNTAILLARIASLLKRTYGAERANSLTHGEVTLNLERSKIEYQGASAELTKNELKILVFLFRNAGKIVPRADLVEFLWDSQLYVDDNTLSVNITRIREKLKEIGLTDFIKTKHRQGYLI